MPVLIQHPRHAAIAIGRFMVAEGDFKEMAPLYGGGNLQLLKRKQRGQKTVIREDKARPHRGWDVGFNPGEGVALAQCRLCRLFYTIRFGFNNLSDVLVERKQGNWT